MKSRIIICAQAQFGWRPHKIFCLTFVRVPRASGTMVKTLQSVTFVWFSQYQPSIVVQPQTPNIRRFYRKVYDWEWIKERGRSQRSRSFATHLFHSVLFFSVLQGSATASWLHWMEAHLSRTQQYTPFALPRSTEPRLRDSKPVI